MTWDETKHPRVPGGRVNGGQFTDKEVGAAVDAATEAAGLSAFPTEFKRPDSKLLNKKVLVELIADRIGEPPEVVQEELDSNVEQLQDIVLNSNLSIRVYAEDLPNIIDDYRLKTQFETGDSEGYYGPKMRADAERNAFGYPGKMNPEKRPVYGYFDWGTPDVQQYGSIQLVMHENVKDRATVSYGDSLNGMFDRNMFPSPARNVDTGAFRWDFTDTSIWSGAYFMHDVDYIEAQIHGGVSLNDVKEVILHKGPWQAEEDFGAVTDLLDDAGIPWYWGEDDD